MSAHTTIHPQSHGSPGLSRLSDMKRKLVQKMEDFMTAGDRVNPTEEQLELAGLLVRHKDPSRYTEVPFGSIIQHNQAQDGQMEMMATAFDVLFRYTVNMLKLKRPRNWHTIKFSNAQFKARADCMVGTRNILKLMGYTKTIEAEDGSQSGLSYPNPTQINHDAIKIIGAELLTAKLEVKTAQEQGNFSFPLPMDNVPLDNPHLNQPMRNPHLDADYYGSMSQQPSQFQSPSSMASTSGNYNSYQIDRPSSYGNPQTLTQHVSYQPPPSTGYHSGGGYQPSGGSYGPPSAQPHNQQYRDHQHSDQFGYQSNYQSSNQSSESTTSFETPPSSLSSSQPSSTEQQPNSGGSGVSSRLAELRRRKEKIIQQAFGNNPPSSGDSYPIGTMPTSAQAPYPPSHQSSAMQPSHVSPSTTTEIQHTNPPPPTAAPTQAAKPPPVKRRTKFLAVAPSNDEVKYPPSLPEETVIQEEPPPPPVQQPQVRKSTLTRSRIMVECDHCGFPNHEKSQECVECQNPQTERWRKVQVPSSVTRELNVVPTTTVADENNQQCPQEREAYDPRSVGSSEIQHSSQQSSVSSGQPSSGTAGASGSFQPLRAYIPVVNYTAKEKEEIRKKAEREKMIALQQEKDLNEGRADAAPLSCYVPNGNYNWVEGGIEARRTGSVLSEAPNSADPEDAQTYKSLGTQGHVLIQDIKEGLRQGFKLEEIQLASQLQHAYQSSSEFLLREWQHYIEHTMFQAGRYSDEEHRRRRMNGSIGQLRRNEIVKVLIEEGGDCNRAAQKCCMNRMKTIQDLMSEVRLPQSQAVFALEKNGFDLEKAIHDVYHEKITNAQLYDYIWGDLEGGGIRKNQNDRIAQMITEKLHGDQYLHRLLMAEYKLPTTNHCNVLVHLVRERNLTLGACLDVAKTNDDIETATHLLTQECPICYVTYTRNLMVNMIHCDHAMCKDCFVVHFTMMIGEKSIKHFNCPVCGEPDMSSETIDMDLYLQMFSSLIQVYLNKEDYNLFSQKLNEHAMIKNPNFRWCIKCTTGFINEVGRQMLQCPNGECSQQMCFQCKKPWEPAHDGLSCEQFAKWKKDNDPELQAQGLAAYLNEEGIECPSCGFKYALAKGGCMHFRCGQCPAEFCSGCNGLFKKDCVKYESCRNKGLHAHHPRDCLFYLRDESVDDLQKLLNDNNVEFDIEPPKGQIDAETAKGIQAVEGLAVAQPALPLAAPPVLKCRVMLQKENPGGTPIDQECGDPVESGHAGLCEKHYKEYLVYKINQNHIDPLPLCTEPGPLRATLLRDEIKVPDQLANETEEQYCERLRQLIKEKLPLKEREVLNF